VNNPKAQARERGSPNRLLLDDGRSDPNVNDQIFLIGMTSCVITGPLPAS
jgi:hypothetical protein